MSNDFIVNSNDNHKRIIYLVKELLKDKTELNVISGTKGAPVSARVCNTLVKLEYVHFGDIRTETSVVNEKRRTSLVIRLIKSDKFDKLYAENEEKKKTLRQNEQNEGQ